MMQIGQVVGDIILLVLHNHEPLKKIGIENDKIFMKINGYDGNGMWIHQPKFPISRSSNKVKKINTSNEFLKASILIPWGFIVSITHFSGVNELDFPNPFKLEIGF
jgi:hypothetical protein